MTSAEGNQKCPQSQGGNWQDIAQTLAAYVAIPVALVYPFGFFALFVQFTHYYLFDFYTAWYAASLVNRMVAMGQGVNILALALVVSVPLAAIIAGILLVDPTSQQTSPVESVLVNGARIMTLMIVGVVILLGYIFSAG